MAEAEDKWLHYAKVISTERKKYAHMMFIERKRMKNREKNIPKRKRDSPSVEQIKKL